MTKATASRRLAALETALGARLVERKPKGLVLTAAGLEALAAANEIDRVAASLEERVAEASDATPRGTVRLTAPQWFAERILIGAMSDLRQRYPELEVDLLGTNQIVNIAQREADLALRNVRPSQPSLAARKVGQLGGCVYASKLYLQRRGTPRHAMPSPGTTSSSTKRWAACPDSNGSRSPHAALRWHSAPTTRPRSCPPQPRASGWRPFRVSSVTASRRSSG